MLTIDTDEIVVTYPSLFELMWDLKGASIVRVNSLQFVFQVWLKVTRL